MATLDERVTEIKNFYGSRLLQWNPLGHPTDNGDGQYNYGVAFRDANDSNVIREDAVQIVVYNKETANEQAYWKNRNYITNTTPSFAEIVRQKADAEVEAGHFKHIEILQTNEDTKKVVIKAIVDVSGNNEVKYYLVTFDANNNIVSAEETVY